MGKRASRPKSNSTALDTSPGFVGTAAEKRALADYLAASRSLAKPDTNEVGGTGTAIWSGDILAESNSKLIHESAYGRSGSRDWGEWDRIIRTDPECSAALEHAKGQIRDATVSVSPADDSEEQAKIADYVRDNVLEWLEPGWPEVNPQMVGGFLGSGFSLHEVVHGDRLDKRLPNGRGYYVRRLSERLPSSIHPNGWVVENDQLVGVRQLVVKGGRVVDVILPSWKLLLISWNRSGDNYQGFSVFRPVWYLAKIREQLLKILAIGHVRESCGVPVAVASDRAAKLTPKQRKSLQKLLGNLVYHENAYVLMPAGWDLKWVFSPAANKGHVLDTWERLGIVILRMLQAQQLAIGTGETGSYASAKVADSSGDAFAMGVVAMLEQVMNGVGDRQYTGLVRKIVEPNWGKLDRYPKISIALKKAKLPPKERAEAIEIGVRAGVITVTPKDEDFLREDIGMPAIDPEEREALRGKGKGEEEAVDPKAGGELAVDPTTALNGAQVTAMLEIVKAVANEELPRGTGVEMIIASFPVDQATAEKIMGEVGKGFEPKAQPAPVPFGKAPGGEVDHESEAPPPGGESDETGEKPLPGGGAAPKSKANRSRASARALYAEEQHFDLMAMADVLDNGRARFERGALPLVTEMLVRAMPEVEAAMVDGDPSEVAELELQTERLEAFAAEFLAGLSAEGYRQLKAEHDKGIDIAEPRADGTPAVAVPPMIHGARGDKRKQGSVKEVLASMGKSLVRRVVSRVRSDLEHEAVEVLRTGGQPGSIVGRVTQRTLEFSGLRTAAGSVVSKAFNLGREEYARERPDDIGIVRLSALLDGDECQVCRRLDGKEMVFGSEEHRQYTPPLTALCEGMDNCRCVLAYGFKRGSP